MQVLVLGKQSIRHAKRKISYPCRCSAIWFDERGYKKAELICNEPDDCDRGGVVPKMGLIGRFLTRSLI
jgi:hypothetical protein